MTESDAPSPRDVRQYEIATSPTWQPVLAHFDYNSGFAFGLILVANSAEAEDCRSALAAHLSLSGRRVLDISTDSPDALKQIASPLLNIEVADDVGAVWAAAVVAESSTEYKTWSSAWREGLARLNQFRNRLQRRIPCSLVFVGAPWVQAVMRTMAPDIWSIRSWVARVTPSGVYGPSEGIKESVPSTAPSRSVDAPDPEFAMDQAERLRGRPGQELALATLLHRAGTGFFDRGEYALAAGVFEESLKLRNSFGADARSTARAEVSLANALQEMGHPEKAKTHYSKAIDMLDAEVDQADVLGAKAGLATSLWSQGDSAGARALEEDVMAETQRVLGPEHPDTLTTMNNLAETLRAQGDLVGALALQEKILDARRRVLGPDHPSTLTSMNNLAGTLRAQGDPAASRALHEEALAAKKRVLGHDHPSTLTSMNNLAETLRTQGDLAGARALQEEVLAARLRVLGPEHPETFTSMSNLAGTLWSLGEPAGARQLEEEALAARRRVLGPEHPDTLISMNNHAETLRSEGDLAAARALQEETLAARRRVLGAEHPNTLISISNLAGTLRSQGDLAGARALQEEVLATRRRVLGPEHPDTLYSMDDLARTLGLQGDADAKIERGL